MKKLSLLLLVSSFPFIVLAQAYWQQQVNFVIDVTLNDTDHTLDGFEKIEYVNNSPDTLRYIWFHLWPNAYKNDKTAFSEQLLINNRTDFYFSDQNDRGYINRLDFKVNGVTAHTEDHLLYIDVIKVVLPQPLLPGQSTPITTPFHVKLPLNFSRGGHTGDSYQITQWYPKPAVYDHKGWHPIPYLEQGEFYSEFGDYNVQVTVPANYVVAATGELQNSEEKEWLSKRSTFTWEPMHIKVIKKKGAAKYTKRVVQLYPLSSRQTKTLQYRQNNIHDFAWFADKRFIVKKDTIQLPSGKIIEAYSYYLPGNENPWDNCIQFIKRAIRFRSQLMGEYPYTIVSVVEAKMGVEGGMEYPTITSISPMSSPLELEKIVEHEVGHNWLYGILANNEREHAWMDEGMNTYYDKRYENWQYPKLPDKTNSSFIESRIPENPERVLLATLYSIKKDQPINTPAEKMTALNYGLITYVKTGEWMELLEKNLGRKMFDSCMQEYYRRWQFKHPYPEDFKDVISKVSGKNMDEKFSLLNMTGPFTPSPARKQLKPALFFNLKDTEKYHYINLLPAIGYNLYDKFMVGALIHNYNLPFSKFQFVVAPLYATGTNTINGIGRMSYTNYFSTSSISKIELSVSGEKFSTKTSLDTFGNKLFQYFYKIVPAVRLSFRQPTLSHAGSNIDFRVFFIGEKTFNGFTSKSGDSINRYPTSFSNTSRYITQLSYNHYNNRVLYPYRYQFQIQQGQEFYRINFNGNYFFNYAKGGGLSMRAFAASFGYIGSKTGSAIIYQPKLLGVRGEEDYTYSNYFIGRTASPSNPDGPIANKGLAAQQIMIRDGGLKLVLDQFDFLQGRSEKWLAALNFNSTLPNNLFPIKIPIKVFFDVGTYAEAWQKDAPTSKFLYTAGLQLSLMKDLINVYLPLFYSKDFRDYIKSSFPQNRLLKTISFSIDIQNFRLGKMNKYLDL